MARPLGSSPWRPGSALAEIDGFWAVIPAGGAGTRLWPLSRSSSPKFLRDLRGSGRTLLQETRRPAGPAGRQTGSWSSPGRRTGTRWSTSSTGARPGAILGEPSPRDSMAAIGLAAALLERADPDAVMGSFAADHVIADQACVRRRRSPRRRRRPRRLAGHPRDRADLPVLGVRLRPPRRRPRRAPRRRPGRRVRREAVSATSPRRTSPPAATAGTPACSSPAPRCCWTCSPMVTRPSPADLRAIAAEPALLEEVWPRLPKIALDHAVAEPRRRRPRSPSPPPSAGTTSATSTRSPPSSPMPRSPPSVLGDDALVHAVDSTRPGRPPHRPHHRGGRSRRRRRRGHPRRTAVSRARAQEGQADRGRAEGQAGGPT